MVQLFLMGDTLSDVGPGLSVGDRAFHYGDGVFETLRYVHGTVPLLSQHLARLERACQALRIAVAIPEIKQRVAFFSRLLTQAKHRHGALKIAVSRGDGQRASYLPSTSASKVLLSYQSAAGLGFPQGAIELVAAPQPLPAAPGLAGIKHMSRLNYIVAELSLPQALQPGQELLLVDEQRQVIETMHHNLFFRVGQSVHTPSLSRCGVQGIMRQWVINTLQEMVNELREGEYSVNLLDEADEVFLTNAVQGVVSVGVFQRRLFNDFSLATSLQNTLQKKFKFYEG